MKKITLFVVVVGFFMSCKKDKDTIPPPPPTPVVAGVLVKDGSAPDKKVETPAEVRVGVFKYTGGTSDTILQVFLNLGNSVPLSQMSNVKVTIKNNLSDSVVLVSPAALVEGHWSNLILFKKNQTVMIYVDVLFSAQIFNKSLTPKLALRDANGPMPWMEYVSGQTTTFGYTSAPSIKSIPSATTQIVNGERYSLLGLEITASSSNDNAVKQISGQHVFADNGVNDTLRYDSLRVFRESATGGMVDITDSVTISDALGNVIHSLSEVPSHSKFYVTYTSGRGEIVITRGTSERIFVTGIARGFRSGDGSGTLALFDLSPAPNGFMYLNKGTVGMHAKLYSSAVAAGGANNFVQNFIWSNMTGPSHSGIYGLSSKDWLNSYGLQIDISSIILNARLAGG